jgi:hypothetical protein
MLQLQELSNALDEIEVRPRSNTKLWDLRKQLEAGYRKNFLDIIDKDDVDLLKRHFAYINKLNLENSFDLSLTDIFFILDSYIEKSNNEPYSQIIEGIKTDLKNKNISQEEFLKFAKKYSAPDQQYPIDIFYKRFFKRSPVSSSLPHIDTKHSETRQLPSLPQIDMGIDNEKPTLTDIFGDELNDLSDDSDDEEETTKVESEEEKLQRVRQRIEDKREEPTKIQIINPRAEPRRGRIALVQDDEPVPRPRIPEPKPVSDKIFFETMADLTKQDCEFLYKKIPWVKDIVNHIYIHPVEGNFEDIIDYENFIEHDSIKFYQPKEKYYFIQCHAHKVQEGNNLTIVKNGETYKVVVAIDTNTKGIVLQNEDMLKAEIDYVRVWNQNKNDNIKDLKRNIPNDDMLLLAKFDLSSSLQDAISGNVPIAYRSSSSPFIDTVIQTILKNANSGESFVRLLANIIVFLKINISFITSSVFIKRLREQIYLPGTLPFLTDADKLPEIFLVKNVPEDTKNFVLEKLEEERIRFTKTFFENLYIGSSMIRRPTKPTLWNKPTQQIELPDIKTICKNRDEIENENDEDIVFYTDLDEVYCFNVFKLYDLFQKSETPINPYTRRPFTDKFIQIFLTRYASKPLVKKIEHVKHQDLTSKLEQMIELELNMLENNLIETENPAFVERFRNSLSPPVNEVEKQQPEDKIESKTNKCMECKKELGADKIGSVFRNKEIAFCGYDCLEKNKAFK